MGFASLKATLNERVTNSSAPVVRQSYAAMAAANARAVPAVVSAQSKKPIRPVNRHVVFIRPAEGQEMKSSDETKERLMQSFDPRTENVRIRNVRKTRDNGLVVETASKEDMEKFVTCVTREATLRTEQPGKRKPKMIMIGVRKEVLEGNLAEAVYDQNPQLEELGITKEELLQNMHPCFQTGRRKEEVTNVVFETSAQVRNALRKVGRLYLDWMSCKVDDYLGISRCYNCQNLGHIAKHCKQERATCRHCAGNGHKANECRAKEEMPKCALCKRSNKPHDHAVNDKSCPSYRLALERLAGQTEYGLRP